MGKPNSRGACDIDGGCGSMFNISAGDDGHVCLRRKRFYSRLGLHQWIYFGWSVAPASALTDRCINR
jgi:hypothetical protein